VVEPATDEAVLERCAPKAASSTAPSSSTATHTGAASSRDRATKQWFMSLNANGLRDTVMAETGKVRWVNPWGQERFSNMMKDRADWCISRQRYWGVPIYMFYCTDCGAEHFDQACLDKLKPIVASEGGDAWFDPARSIGDFLPAGAKCQACGKAEFRKETDTWTWVDSGASISVLKARRPGVPGRPT
jgi:isoleucyl-tRNA synthetase